MVVYVESCVAIAVVYDPHDVHAKYYRHEGYESTYGALLVVLIEV